MNRWPVQPLFGLGHSKHRLAGALHMSGRTLNDAIEHGLTDWQADRAAIRLGRFPSQVWPDWIDKGLTEIDRRFLDGGWRQAWLYHEGAA